MPRADGTGTRVRGQVGIRCGSLGGGSGAWSAEKRESSRVVGSRPRQASEDHLVPGEGGQVSFSEESRPKVNLGVRVALRLEA